MCIFSQFPQTNTIKVYTLLKKTHEKSKITKILNSEENPIGKVHNHMAKSNNKTHQNMSIKQPMIN